MSSVEDNERAGDCLCESCSADAVEAYLGTDDCFATVVAHIYDSSLTAIACIEHFPARYTQDLVDERVVDALNHVLHIADITTSPPTRLTYLALRAIAALLSKLPSTRNNVFNRCETASELGLLISTCANLRLPPDRHHFATFLCCALGALWPADTFVPLHIIATNKLAVMDSAGQEIRRALFETGVSKRFIFSRLFAAVSKPRTFCQVERSLLSGDNPCLHSGAMATLARIFLDESSASDRNLRTTRGATAVHPVPNLPAASSQPEARSNEPVATELQPPEPACRRIVLREVPSALAITMTVIRESTVPREGLCHALYVLRELLRGEDNGGRAVRDLLRLAPDALRVFIDFLFRADDASTPPLLDLLFTICTHAFADEEDVERAARVAGFGDVAVLLLKEESGTDSVHKAACIFIQAAAASTEACFVRSLLVACVTELDETAPDMLPARFQSPLAARVVAEITECLFVYDGADAGAQARYAHVLPPPLSGQEPNSPAWPDSMDSPYSRDALQSDGLGGGVANYAENRRGANGSRLSWDQQGKLAEKWRNHRCEHCGNEDSAQALPYMFCKGCRRSHFCGARHQRDGWAFGHHKSLCQAFRRFGQVGGQPSIVTHRSGTFGPSPENVDAVTEYIDLTIKLAAEAGIPASAIIFVVEFPPSLRNSAIHRRTDAMSSRGLGSGPGQIRVSWETPFDWVGLHRRRVLSFEMDLDQFPSLKQREDANAAEKRWSDRMRRSWWNSSHGDDVGDSIGSCAIDDANRSEAADRSSHSESHLSSTRREVSAEKEDHTSPNFSATARQYRIAWWSYSCSSGRRNLRYTHFSLPDRFDVPTISLSVGEIGEEVD